MEQPKLILGEVHCDDRGTLSVVNDFAEFEKMKRFYQIKNVSKDVVRAFHGHFYEEKYIYVTNGSAKIFCAKMKEHCPAQTPKGSMKKVYGLHEKEEFILTDKLPSILHIPKGYANGFKALEENTTIIFFSTSTLEESKNDDIRFDWNHFGEDIWNTQNR